MAHDLPDLIYEDLLPTRDYLRDVALVLGSLQRAFLQPHPRDWQHGLEVNMRGFMTQAFSVADEERRASVDLVTQKVRLDGSKWRLDEYAPPQILNNIKVWLASQMVEAKLEEPQFTPGARHFNVQQAETYATALWWYDVQFRELKASLKGGVTSPILLYPHHFDLALSWFPHDDDRQLSVGWSTGDEHITEPYMYVTAYPEPLGFTDIALPEPAYWHAKGFSGAILLHKDLVVSSTPQKLLQAYIDSLLLPTAQLFEVKK